MYPELMAVSPIDGRYEQITNELSEDFSEYGLIYFRMQVEIEYLIALSRVLKDQMPIIDKDREKRIQSILENFDLRRAKEIKAIETEGDKKLGRKPTHHDVKSVEIWLADEFKERALDDLIPWLHFALTSMDTDTLAYGLMLQYGIVNTLRPALTNLERKLASKARGYADLPMLARTHGQAATPTTFGKEFAVFAARLSRQIRQLGRFELLVKFGGASGNWNAHMAAFPNMDWVDFSVQFVESFNKQGSGIRFVFNPYATQIEPHDTYAELFGIFMRINTILLDLCQDMWRYISDDWLVQVVEEGQVGSSTMPHKVNPINFENAEGNLGMANAMMEFFCRKLPVSRLQRDLSDSTVMRNFGVAFGHCLIAYHNIVQGLGKISPNEAKIREALNAHPEVITEAYQTILRREGVPEAYEKLRELTQGKPMTLDLLREFVEALPISTSAKFDMESITPENYIGLAAELARKS